MHEEGTDFVEIFIDECLSFSIGEVPTRRVYERYCEYCEEMNQKKMSILSFIKKMRNIAKESGLFGFIPRVNTRQESRFDGLALK